MDKTMTSVTSLYSNGQDNDTSHVPLFKWTRECKESTDPNRYTAKAKFCFCKNNKRMIINDSP
jgi:hypothetical protein